MLIDTHCHLNMMVKKNFDTPLSVSDIPAAQKIVDEAAAWNVPTIINVGTSLVESKNCVLLAEHIPSVFASIGIHPNDCTSAWKKDFTELEKMIPHKKIVGIGETGIDRHYPDYDMQRQSDAFRAQIELALKHDLALIVHSRDAYDETLRIIEEYRKEKLRGVMHCFSYDYAFAQNVIEWKFVLGIGGTVTYPRNDELRDVVKQVPLTSIVLETDAPFLPIQSMRGEQNHPKYILKVAEYLANIRTESIEAISEQTGSNARTLFKL